MNRILSLLATVSGNTIVSISTQTVPVLKGGKNNPLQGKVVKITEGASAMVFTNEKSNGYENMVRRRLEQEGKDSDFVVGERKWGVRVPGTPMIVHNNKQYVELIYLNSGKTRYEVNGQVVSASDIDGLDKVESYQGGLDNKVFIRTVASDNIKQLKINGQVYTA